MAYSEERKNFIIQPDCITMVPPAASAVRCNQRLFFATASTPMSSSAMKLKRPKGLSWPVEQRIGVKKPPSMPSTATTCAFNRTASRKAAAVISVIIPKATSGSFSGGMCQIECAANVTP